MQRWAMEGLWGMRVSEDRPQMLYGRFVSGRRIVFTING